MKVFFWRFCFFAYFVASLYAFYEQESNRRYFAAEAHQSSRETVDLRRMQDNVRQHIWENMGNVFVEGLFDDYETRYLGKGRISYFGGPDDRTIPRYKIVNRKRVRSTTAVTGEVAHELDPNDYYCAYKWDYKKYPREVLKDARVLVKYKNRSVMVRVVDWGPRKRMIDVSPGTMEALGCQTDDHVEAYLILPDQNSDS